MSKADVLLTLNRNRQQLESYRSKLKTLEEKYKTLYEFSNKCVSCINSFDASMLKRKRRLLSFDSLLKRVKSAVQYSEKVSELLNGYDYSETVSAIEQLQSSISAEKRKVNSDIQYVEEQIQSLEIKVADLQYEYDTYPEEVEENVK